MSNLFDRLLVAVLRFIFTSYIGLFYRLKIDGLENLPATGAALLVMNHVSWLDGLLVAAYIPRQPRLIALAEFVTGGLKGRASRYVGTIPIDTARPKSVVQAIRTARQAIRQGELVGIFPEGGITRTGEIGEFRPGFLSILEGSTAPVIPIYLGDLWGSIFSYSGGKFFWKVPRKLPYPIHIVIGRPLCGVRDPEEVRAALQRMAAESANA